MMERKKDADLIQTYVESLAIQCELSPSLKWWPRYLFRLENISQAASILNIGKVYSRNNAGKYSLSCSSSACEAILGHTSDEWKQHVRLYFRPRTPFQYVTEGIRSKIDLSEYKAHCAVPVLFLFNSIDILTREITRFSNGNLGSRHVSVGNDFGFFEKIPFKDVYHDTGWGNEGEKIKFHRHAEVMTPQELDLNPLLYIVCRTNTDRETLINLLESNIKKQWKDKIRVLPNLFYCEYNYVENVSLGNEDILIQFKCGGRSNEFQLNVEVLDIENHQKYRYMKDSFNLSLGLKLGVALLQNHSYSISVTLDDVLAYKGIYICGDIPF